MEKVSSRMFFTVMWSGLCQALGWFFGLFGYKREGKFAKCVWGLFATSATIVMGFVAFNVVYGVSEEICTWYKQQHRNCRDPFCYENTFIHRNIYFHNCNDGKGYIYNIQTGKKILEHVEWIAEPNGEDSLICFSNGKKRGYISKNTGKVIIEPKYDHAGIFSDGLASIEEDGYIKFIDGTGKVVIDKKIVHYLAMEEYVFHNGYCIVNTDDGELFGLMDKTGNIALPMEYSSVQPVNGVWQIQKGKEMAVLDSEFKPILPFMECSIYIDEGTIDVTMPDHTMRKYDMQGSLINDFYITNVRTLEYKKDEICYRRTNNDTNDIEDDEDDNTSYESYHPEATARLKSYIAGDGYEGLMTADGQIVTKPLYKDIEAIGYDVYLCEVTNKDKIIVNGKGEIVK